MSGQPPRKVPRIISRQRNSAKAQRDQNAAKGNTTTTGGQEALTKELNKEKHVVKDGCLVAVQQIDKGQVHGVLGASANHGGRRFVIDVPAQDPEIEPYIENPLPGVADQVESYPCSFCPDMVFLTHYGLERHAKQKHKENYDQIMGEIEKIQKEWERREKERSRLREKALIAKARHESYAQSALNYAQKGGKLILPDAKAAFGPERFEACKICNILINVRNPTAMEHHIGAHRKNDELRSQLVRDYGEAIVSQLTCRDCRLVFTDSHKFDQHIEQTHSKKRKFLCKYCAQMCDSMASLNSHKAEIHAVNATTAQNLKETNLLAHKRILQQNVPQGEYVKDVNFSRVYRMGHEDSVCSTQCPVCHLRLVRPSLLVRHMMRVHNTHTFSCDIVTRGMPNFRIEVVNSKIFWWCCSQRYIDRHEFLFHRKQEHVEPYVEMTTGPTNACGQNETAEERVYNVKEAETMPLQPGSSSYNADLVHAHDTTYRVVLPEGLGNAEGQIYVVLSDGEGHKNGYIEDHDGLNELHEEEIQGEIIDDGIDYAEHLTQEQLEQLREQYGDNLLVYNYDNEQILEDVVEEHLVEDDGLHHHDPHDHLVNKPPDDLTCDEIFDPMP